MKQSMLAVITFMLLLAACSPAPAVSPPPTAAATQVPSTAAPAATPAVPKPLQSQPSTPATTQSPFQAALPTVAAPSGDCPGDHVNLLGQQVAGEYIFTTYEEVMGWFCAGAEFEDILTALETQDQTGFPAGKMLEMLADGLVWQQIWLIAIPGS